MQIKYENKSAAKKNRHDKTSLALEITVLNILKVSSAVRFNIEPQLFSSFCWLVGLQ